LALNCTTFGRSKGSPWSYMGLKNFGFKIALVNITYSGYIKEASVSL